MGNIVTCLLFNIILIPLYKKYLQTSEPLACQLQYYRHINIKSKNTMKLIKHNAFFNDPWKDLEQFLETTVQDFNNGTSNRSGNGFRNIPLNITEGENNWNVRLELPGVQKEDIGIELENGVLTINAKREEKTKEGSSTLSFKRSLNVGEEVDTEKLSANLDSGMLSIDLPKREAIKPRQISIS